MAFRGFIQYEEADRPTLIFWDAEARRYSYETPNADFAASKETQP
jgi:hypothetical protein